MRSLSQRQLVRGKVSAVDGSGLGDDFRLVALGGVSASRPIIVAWRLLSGPASQKGKEAAVTRQLIEQVLEVAGPQAIGWRMPSLPMGPWWPGSSTARALMRRSRLPEDRLLSQDRQGLAAGQLIDWTPHRSVRTIGGHKQLRAGEVTSWDGFTETAASDGMADASLWACLIRDVTTAELAAEPPRAVVSPRSFADGFAAWQAFRPRWHIEAETYRELKEGWEQQRWGRDFAAALGRTTLTCLAFKTAQVSRLPAGERLASVAMRRLHQRELGTAPRESLLPAVRTPSASDAPT